MRFYVRVAAAIASLAIAAFIVYRGHEGFLLQVVAEIPFSATQELRVHFNDDTSLLRSAPLKTCAAALRVCAPKDFAHVFDRLPRRLQSIDIVPAKFEGVDIKLYSVSILAPPRLPGAGRAKARKFDLASFTFTDMSPTGVPGSYRTTGPNPLIRVAADMELDSSANTAVTYVTAFILFVVAVWLTAPIVARRGTNLMAISAHLAKLPQIIWRGARPILFYGVLFAIPLLVSEAICRFVIVKFFPTLETQRRLYADDNSTNDFRPKYVGEAYLNYIPATGFTWRGIAQHNEAGYRGTQIPVARVPGKLRILFLGGSTTYDVLVPDPENTYPAQTGRALKKSLSSRQLPFTDVEVINGGMDFATSAEFVTHYIMKYRFYRPDIVVIHTGLNDSMAGAFGNYRPDYTHWRKPVMSVLPLPSALRWTMQSRVIGFPVLWLLNSDNYNNYYWLYDALKLREKNPWYKADVEGVDYFEARTIGFRNNIETVVREIQADNAKVVLFQESVAPYIWRGGDLEKYMNLNKKILEDVAKASGSVLVPFPLSIIQRGRFIDGVHLDEAGASELAEHIAPYIAVAAQNNERRVSGNRSARP